MMHAALTNLGSTFGGTTTKPQNPLFVTYWRRTTKQPAPGDALLDGALPREEKGLRRSYAQLRKEARDPVWAPSTEAALRAMLKTVPHLDGSQNPVHAACGAALCEISASTPPGVASPITDAFYRDLQSARIDQAIATLGLSEEGAVFGRAPGAGNRHMFVAYLTRTKF